jgi:nucleoid-associated protein YgaU
MPDTTLQLGDFVFSRFEVPEEIPFGGDQKLIVHELIGGVRVVDAMGDQPTALDWSGIFVGQDALDRALYLDGQRKAGHALSLTWSGLRFTVVIRALNCSFRRFYRLPYRITCEVVSDDTAPVLAANNPAAEQLITDDLASANTVAAAINDDPLSGLMATLNSAVAAAGSLHDATSRVILGIEAPLNAVRSRISALITAGGQLIDDAASVGGIVSGGLITAQVNALSAQIDAIGTGPSLLSLDRLLGRIDKNIRSLNAGTRTRTAVGGNLFEIAAKEYGNSAAWATIALANGLTDPWIQQVATLAIPPDGNEAAGLSYPNAADFIPAYPDDALIDVNEFVAEPVTTILEDG